VRALKVSQLRNLVPATIEPGPRFNVFYGDNGQGKTNLLEAIYLVGTLRSFRTARVAELISIDHDKAFVSARVQRGGLERTYEVTLAPRSKTVRLDGKTVRPISKYFGDFNVVLFAPEDLQVLRSSPGDRRRFIDRAVFNRRPAHLDEFQSYERTLRSRNALLRDADGRLSTSATAQLDVYDEQLARYGASVIAARTELVELMAPRLSAAFEAITRTGFEVRVEYVSSHAGALLAALQETRRRDLARGVTQLGPHRDDLQLFLAGQLASAFASQGQMRALVLAWKTAELELLADVHGDAPILLLDDVSSELDATRNEYLFDFLRTRGHQCFITTTHPDHVLVAAERVDFELGSGTVTRQK
jgi:DNA replication and repair protein RecF